MNALEYEALEQKLEAAEKWLASLEAAELHKPDCLSVQEKWAFGCIVDIARFHVVDARYNLGLLIQESKE